MRRALVGICVGAVAGVLTLIGFGAWTGYNGVLAPPALPLQSAALWANEFLHAYWWLAAGIGGVMGGVGNWLARPRRSAPSSVSSHE